MQTDLGPSELDRLRDDLLSLVPYPGDVPELHGLDVAWRCRPMNGVIGGDLLTFVDFRKRFDLDARIDEVDRDGRQEFA